MAKGLSDCLPVVFDEALLFVLPVLSVFSHPANVISVFFRQSFSIF